MAKINGSSLAGRQSFWKYVEAAGRPVDLSRRKAGLAAYGKPPGHRAMRSDPDSGRRIDPSNIGEKKQHQQRAAFRDDIDTMGIVIAWDRILTGKALVDVPAGITRVVGMRKAYRKAPDTAAWAPAFPSDELVERRMEDRRIDGHSERSAAMTGNPNHRPRPGCWIVWITTSLAPEQSTAFLSHVSWKSSVDTNETILDELLDLVVAEGGIGMMMIVRHWISFRLTASFAEKQFGGFVGQQGPSLP